MIQAEARIEAKAQAKIYAKEVADQFNAIHEKDVKIINTLMAAINTLGCQMSVCAENLSLSRQKFDALVAEKEAEFKKANGK